MKIVSEEFFQDPFLFIDHIPLPHLTDRL